MRHTRHILSYSGGKDSTAMYLLALELAERHGFDFTPVFADTGNEHEATLDYVRDLPRRTGGPEIRWVKADFAEDFERKRRFIAAKWPGDLVKDVPGRWEVRPEFMLQDEDGETVAAECVPDEAPPEPADPYRPKLSTFYQWVPARRGLSPEEAAIRVERALAALHPTGNPFLDLCMLKGRFPSTKARFCSEELKHHPVFYQVQEPLLEAGHRVLSWQGVRAEESASRAKLRRFEHVGGGLWNWRPIFRWTAETVFAMHRRHDVPPNPLYTLGMGRVGCMPCIHARKDEIWEIARRFPEHIDRIEAWETAVGMCAKREGIGSFFAADKTANHDKTKPIPGIRDVVAWASTGRGGAAVRSAEERRRHSPVLVHLRPVRMRPAMDSPFLDRTHWLDENDFAAIIDQPPPYTVSPGHCLVVPKRAVPTVLDMTDAEWMGCIALLREQVARIDAQHRPDGYNIGINCHAAAGQTIYHAHIHIIPRYWGDHPNPRGGGRAVIPGKADYT